MLWVPQKGDLLVQHNLGAVGTATFGSAATTGGSASTKGTAVELISSTNFDAYWVTILASNYGVASGGAAEGCLDILLGAATEEVIISNLLMGYCGGLGGQESGPKRWDFPLYIPAGSRIAAQVAGAKTSTAMYVAIELRGGTGSPPWRVGGKVTTYGMGTVPNGTSLTPGASGAEGSYAQITASTSEDHFALVASLQPSADTALLNRNLAVDIGIGSATEEQIVESLWFASTTAESFSGPYNSFPVFKDIPSGTRLAMRASCNDTLDTGFQGVIHAVS